MRKAWIIPAVIFGLSVPTFAQQRMGGCLAISLPRSAGRTVWAIDEIEVEYIIKQKFPVAGDSFISRDGSTYAWEKEAADSSGWFAGRPFRNGYAFFTIESQSKRTIIMRVRGAVRFFANGVVRVGSKYDVKDQYASWEPRFDFVELPVRLKIGENRFFFRCSRGRLKVEWFDPPKEVYFSSRDVTLPDVILGESGEINGAVLLINSGGKPLRDGTIFCQGEGMKETAAPAGPLQPRSVRKVRFTIHPSECREEGKKGIQVILREGKKELARTELFLEVKRPDRNHTRTFISSIDGSVQYYAVNPARGSSSKTPPALVLSVHGAGVKAANQAGSYEPKSWADIIAPTNRRPFGYDWEDWGRQDALEVLRDVTSRYSYDPSRVYLTGHSMGGHGAWQLGALYPDRWAAIGPSAGWISFSSYAPRQEDSSVSRQEELINRAALASNTLAFKDNYRQFGVYIIHGEKDESVPVEQARHMVRELKEFHEDFRYHEEPGAGHWWDTSLEDGADCLDWAPLFDFFARHRRPAPEEIRQVDFTTPSPGISASCQWVTIGEQQRQCIPSSVSVRLDPSLGLFEGTTENVALLALERSPLMRADTVIINLDSSKVVVASPPEQIWLERGLEGWHQGGPPSPLRKGPRRYGTFKDGFRNRVIFVYGSTGSREENEWAFAKARFDAECFWYQGNGSVEVISDKEFRPAAYPDNNVILYGNSRSNRAWRALLGLSPLQVSPGTVTLGGKTFRGDDLACLFIRPRPDSETASVAAVAGTGIRGMRLSNTRPYLFSGYALPDVVIVDSRVEQGDAAGLLAAGFFGLDWSVEGGEFAW